MTTKLEAAKERALETHVAALQLQTDGHIAMKDRAYLLRLVGAYKLAYDRGWENDTRDLRLLLEESE